jgi:hypothetical protein
VICGAPGVSDAYYCKECVLQEKDVRFYFYSLFIFIKYLISSFDYREMDVQRLLIWDLRKQIYFMNGKNMGLRKDDIYCLKSVGNAIL